jgi:hypothetical protein
MGGGGCSAANSSAGRGSSSACCVSASAGEAPETSVIAVADGGEGRDLLRRARRTWRAVEKAAQSRARKAAVEMMNMIRILTFVRIAKPGVFARGFACAEPRAFSLQS